MSAGGVTTGSTLSVGHQVRLEPGPGGGDPLTTDSAGALIEPPAARRPGRPAGAGRT